MASLRWILEPDAFAHGDQALEAAVRRAGHGITHWNDEWWSGGCPAFDGDAVVFHGSVENAARIRAELSWEPGSFCNVAAFHCSAWYPKASRWLLNRDWRKLTAEELTSHPASVLADFGNPNSIFVRPDSPLKPFSGRVLPKDGITLAALDYGFYFDDPGIPVIVARICSIEREWRYVVADRQVVAGSGYTAEHRSASSDDARGETWQFAQQVASELDPPECVYVMDICQTGDRLALVELNPFSGADLYNCDADKIVAAVSAVALAGSQSA